MSVRKLGVALAVVCAALLIVPVAAGAQTAAATPIQTTSLARVPVTGKARNGKTFAGHYDVSRFVTRGGKTYALGTLTGKLGNWIVKRSNVLLWSTIIFCLRGGEYR